MYRLTPVLDLESYDELLAKRGAHLTQGETYRLWQEQAGRDVRAYVLEKQEGDVITPILVGLAVVHTISFGKKLMDMPHGPVALVATTPDDERAFVTELEKIISREKVVFVQIAPSSVVAEPGFGNLHPVGQYHYRPGIFQPRFEWIMDIPADTSTLFASLKKNTRYTIRQTKERGITTEVITENLDRYADTLYGLMQETGTRGGFTPHERSYYEQVLKTVYGNDKLFIVTASFEGVTLALNVIVCRGQNAMYLFSASSSQHKDLQASYAAQWKTIETLSALGITRYSLGGVAPETAAGYASWQAITTFKHKFPGTLHDTGLWYDVVGSRPWYYLYCLYRLFQYYR